MWTLAVPYFVLHFSLTGWQRFAKLLKWSEEPKEARQSKKRFKWWSSPPGRIVVHVLAFPVAAVAAAIPLAIFTLLVFFITRRDETCHGLGRNVGFI